MREIKFRGKSVWSNEWIYGNGARNGKGNENYIHTPEGMIQTHEGSNGQFTGLTDEKGTEIYEGDIIQITDDNDNPFMYKVVYSDYAFGVELITDESGYPMSIEVSYAFGDYSHHEIEIESDDEMMPLAQFLMYHCVENGIEVIGNAFENPELMKGDENECY